MAEPRTKARDRRFRKLVDNRFAEFARMGDGTGYDGPPDFAELVTRYGINWEGWQTLNQEFEVTECVRRGLIAAKRSEAGRKGGQAGGRGRGKKKKAP